MTFESLETLLEQYPYAGQFVMAAVVLILGMASYLVTKHYILKGISGLVRRTKTRLDDILLHGAVPRRISYVAPLEGSNSITSTNFLSIVFGLGSTPRNVEL